MNQKKGMTLLEILIYLSCWALLITLAGYAALKVHESIRISSTITDRWLQLALAMHQLKRDIKTYTKNPLRRTDKNYLICGHHEGDIGWTVDKGRLIRITGKYHPGSCMWSKRAISVVLEAAEELLFFYYYKKARLIGIRCILSGKGIRRPLSLEAFVACQIEADK